MFRDGNLAGVCAALVLLFHSFSAADGAYSPGLSLGHKSRGKSQ